jgi:hypothetical protein
MSATVAADFVFVPVVWKDHIDAYFRKKLVFGSAAVIDNTLTTSPGLTVTFPYFKAIGAVEEPGETDSLAVDSLSDDSFYATVKEVGKAVGIKKKAFKKSAANQDAILSNAQKQLARVMAEKIDADLLTEFSTVTNFVNGYTATDNLHCMTVARLLEAKTVGLGDRSNEAAVVFMHSLQFMTMMADTTAGFLKADANDPMAMVGGFMGRILGMAVVISDQIPKYGSPTQIDGRDAYRAFIHTPEAYGVILKQSMEVESDYDILAREHVITVNEWYAVKSFHAKIASNDYRTVECITVGTTGV